MTCKKPCVVVLLVVAAAIFAEATIHLRKVEKQILDNILSSQHYDPRIRPAGLNGTYDAPLDVNVTLFVIGIQKVDDDKMLYSLDVYFRQEWLDERLKYSPTTGIEDITIDEEEAIWRPDLFFNDYKGYSHEVTVPNFFIRVKSDGSVLYSKRWSTGDIGPSAVSFFTFHFVVMVMILFAYTVWILIFYYHSNNNAYKRIIRILP